MFPFYFSLCILQFTYFCEIERHSENIYLKIWIILSVAIDILNWLYYPQFDKKLCKMSIYATIDKWYYVRTRFPFPFRILFDKPFLWNKMISSGESHFCCRRLLWKTETGIHNIKFKKRGLLEFQKLRI